MISNAEGWGGTERRGVEGQKIEREERRRRGREGARQKQLQSSIWILLAAVGKI